MLKTDSNKKQNYILKILLAVILGLLLATGLVAPLEIEADATCSTAACIQDELDAMVSGAGSSTVITLTQGVVIDLGDFHGDSTNGFTGGVGFTIPAGYTVTLDLNGGSIKGRRVVHSGSGATAVSCNTAMFVNYGNFIIKDTQYDPNVTVSYSPGTVADGDTSSNDSLTTTDFILPAGGVLQMSSNIYRDWNAYNNNGTTHSTGAYVVENRGTLTIESGNLINLGGADVPYVVNNLSDSNSSGPVTTTVNGGFLKAYAGTVFRIYTPNGTQLNTVNINGGELFGATTVVWIQQAGPSTSKTVINVSGGTLTGEGYGTLRASINNASAEVEMNVSGGTLINNSYKYSETIVSTPKPRVRYNINFDTMGNYTVMQAAAPKVLITGGEFISNVPADDEGTNISHVMPREYAPYYFVKTDNFDIQGGIFTHNPADYVTDTDTPIASLTENDSLYRYYVENGFIMIGADVSSFNNDDKMDLISGILNLSNNQSITVATNAEFDVNSGAVLNIDGTFVNNGLLTNNGTIDTTGTLTNNTVIQNDGVFTHTSGNVDGVIGAWIRNGANALTDTSDNLTVFHLIPADNSVEIPLTGTAIANTDFEFRRANSWVAYGLQVNGGSGSGTYPSSKVVKISANAAPAGKVFSHWETQDGNYFANMYAASTTYTMPKNGVIIIAIYKDAPSAIHTSPATGVSDSMKLWSALAVLSLSGLLGLSKTRKTKTK